MVRTSWKQIAFSDFCLTASVLRADTSCNMLWGESQMTVRSQLRTWQRGKKGLNPQETNPKLMEMSKPRETNSREILTHKKTFIYSCQSHFNNINHHNAPPESPLTSTSLFEFELSIPQLTFQASSKKKLTFQAALFRCYPASKQHINDCAQGGQAPTTTPLKSVHFCFGNMHENHAQIIKWKRSPQHFMIGSFELSVLATRNSETSYKTKTSIFQCRFISQCTDIQLCSTISVCTPRHIGTKKMERAQTWQNWSEDNLDGQHEQEP